MTKHAKIPEPGNDNKIRLIAVPPVLWPHLVRWLAEERGLAAGRLPDSDVWTLSAREKWITADENLT